MAAPTLLDYAESNFADTGSTTDTTDDLDWAAASDVIVVLGITEDNGLTMATPTGTGITLSALSGLPTNTGSSCKGYGWSGAVSGNGNSTLVSTNGASGARGIAAWAFSGSDGLGTPVVSVDTNLTHNVTVAQADSTVVMILGDWNATSDVTVTTVPAGGTIREATQAPGTATFLVIEWANQATGTRAYGVSAWTGTGTITKVTVEAKGTASGAVAKDGHGLAAAVGYGTARKVATAGGTRVFLAAAGFAVARRVVAVTGVCSIGVVGRAVAVRRAPETGRAAAAGAGYATARRVAPGTGRAVAALAGTGTPVKRGTPTGRLLAGGAGYATARHVAVLVGRAVAGAGGYGDATGATPPRAVQGAGGAVLLGYGAAGKRAPLQGRAVAGAAGYFTAMAVEVAVTLTGADAAAGVVSSVGDRAPWTMTSTMGA